MPDACLFTPSLSFWSLRTSIVFLRDSFSSAPKNGEFFVWNIGDVDMYYSTALSISSFVWLFMLLSDSLGWFTVYFTFCTIYFVRESISSSSGIENNFLNSLLPFSKTLSFTTYHTQKNIVVARLTINSAEYIVGVVIPRNMAALVRSDVVFIPSIAIWE